MPNNHAKAIRGMSIACIVISSLVLLPEIAGFAFMLIGGPYLMEILSDPYLLQEIASEFEISSSAISLFGLKAGIVSSTIMTLLTICASGALLAASIIMLVNYNKPEKYGMCFIWSIIGAVLGYLSGGIILGVLFTLIAVFVSSDKKLYESDWYKNTPPMNR